MSLLKLVKFSNASVKVKLSGTLESSVKSLDKMRKKYDVTHHIFFLLDCSGSMEGSKFRHAKRGVAEFAEKISSGAILNFIAFSDEAWEVSSFEGIKTDETTNMSAAIVLAQEKMPKNGRRTIILATDGKANNPDKALKRARVAKEAGIKVICIGTHNADEDFLKKLSSRRNLGKKVSQGDFRQAIAQSGRLLLK